MYAVDGGAGYGVKAGRCHEQQGQGYGEQSPFVQLYLSSGDSRHPDRKDLLPFLASDIHRQGDNNVLGQLYS